MNLASISGIVDVEFVRGSAASASSAPDLVIEIPHGATHTIDFDTLAARLTSPLPDGLVDFFHVNTDIGAPELAVAAAHKLVELKPSLTVLILRCRIPRTFIDCNRRVDASPEEFRSGKVTPGLMPWITTPEDRALLRASYDTYIGAVRAASALLGRTGAMLMLHSYAPRTVDVEVDADIVTNLRRAYLPEVEPTWPLRPDLDIIARDTDGKSHEPVEVARALREQLAPLNVAASDTYPLHPSTLAWEHVMAHPGRALCLEVRRDHLAEPFEPFAQMTIGAAKLERLAGPLALALSRWW